MKPSASLIHSGVDIGAAVYGGEDDSSNVNFHPNNLTADPKAPKALDKYQRLEIFNVPKGKPLSFRADFSARSVRLS